MLLLLAFAFLGGVITVLSPCALPLLPILLSGTVSEGKARPWGIVVGFVGGFVAFTLGVTALVQLFSFPVEGLRWGAGALIVAFGLVTLVPALSRGFEALATRWTQSGNRKVRLPADRPQGFVGGLAVGLSLGLAWSPCVGPIMASVLTLALSLSVTWSAVALTLAFSLGTAIPLFAFLKGGRALLARSQVLRRHLGTLQKGFAVLMVATGVALLAGWDRDFQSLVLGALPGWSSALTGWENQPAVWQELDRLQP